MKLLNYIRIKLGKCNHFFAYPQTELRLDIFNCSYRGNWSGGGDEGGDAMRGWRGRRGGMR